jgi:hypothetical protein
LICKGCGESYNEEMFPVCPFCLTPNEILEHTTENSSMRDIGTTSERKVESVSLKEGGQEEVYKVKLETVELTSLCSEDNSEIAECESNMVCNENVTIEESEDAKIVDVFFDNKFNLFIRFCEENSMFYMSDLDGFDFTCLTDVHGIGKGKIDDIIKQYEVYNSGDFFEKQSKEHKETKIKHFFTYINEQLVDLDITFLIGLGIRPKATQALANRGYRKIGDIQNMSMKTLHQIVGARNVEKFEAIEENLKKALTEIFREFLEECSKEEDFKLDIKRSDGYTLQELGDENGLTRERMRQRIVKFNSRLDSFMDPLVDFFMSCKNYVTEQELLDIYDNDDFGKILIYWCKNNKKLEYLGFAEVFVYANEKKGSVEDDILLIAEEFIGDSLNLNDNLEELDALMHENGYPYVEESAFLNLVQKHGYKVYGDFVVKGKLSYGKLCARIVEDKFPSGIKLYDEVDLNLLRKYVFETYGDIDMPDGNRALSSRIADFLVLSGRGTATAVSNVQVEMFALEEIKEYIDQAQEGEIYYSELFSRFEGLLRMTSNIDNYNFLHGVLKLYFSEDYDFSNRDYLKKKGEGYVSGKLSTKVKNYVVSEGKPVHRKDIKKNLPGLTDIVLLNAVASDDELFLWDYNWYFSISLMSITTEDCAYLKKQIEDIMIQNDGYCSDNMIFDEVGRSRREFLDKNGIENPNNLYYLCQKIFAKDFDFRRPHIGKKGMFEEMSLRNVALQLLGYPEEMSFNKYQTMAERLKWSPVTTGMVFGEIEQDYIRLTSDLYLKKTQFKLPEGTIDCVEQMLRNNMDKGFVSLINFDQWDEFPNIGYEWNVYFLRSLIDKFVHNLKIVETRSKDRRYERGIAVDAQSEIMDYADLVVSFLKKSGYSSVTENNMLTLLIMNNLTYKMIPKEIYSSDKFVYENGIFRII